MARDWQNLHTFQIIYPICCAFSLFFCVFCYIHKCNSAHCVTVVSRKILVTWAISRIQCKVFAYSDVCYKPPSVPLCCSFLVFYLLTGCIDHNIRRLLEPRVAQSWAFLVWEHSECTIRPVLPKPVKSGNCFVKKVNPIPARFSKVSPELHQIPILTHGVAIWEAGHAQLWNGGTERERISSLAQKGRTGVCVCLLVIFFGLGGAFCDCL